jgi:sulfatase maturation enzyme AslB (radical SAM superfamily)
MELKFLDHPLEKITIDTTNQCNLSCRLCFVKKVRTSTDDSPEDIRFFPYALFAKLCGEIKLYSNKDDIAVGLSGGEPFVLPHINEIIRQAFKERMKFFIFTNGTLISSFLDLISSCPPPNIVFSVDGLEKEHDANRGRGIFKKIEEAIISINNIKNKLQLKKPRLSINTIISRVNYNDFFKIIPWAEKLHINSVSFSLVQWNNTEIVKKIKNELVVRYGNKAKQSAVFDGLKNEFCRPRRKELEILINNLDRIKAMAKNKKINLDLYFFPDFSNADEYRHWFSGESYKIDRCTNIFNQIRINFNGYVSAGCGIPVFVLGNLHDDSLSNIINGPRARAFAADIKKRGYFYACARCCRRSGKSRAIFDKN